MSVYDGPIKFRGVSFVTASLVTSKDPELGAKTTEGGNDYRWMYNGGNSTINPGYGVVLQSGATGYTMTLSSVTSADLVVGVVKHAAIATACYGWVLTKGFVNVQMGATSGTVAAADLLDIAGNGVFVKASNTTGNLAAPVGQALAAIVSSASGAAYVRCFG